MRKDIIFSLAVLLLGVAGGVLRGFELTLAFESETGLMVNGHPLTISLIALSALVCAVVIFYSFRQRMSVVSSYDQVFRLGKPSHAILPMLSAAALIASAVVSLFPSGLDDEIHRVVFACLCVTAAVSVILIQIRLRKNSPLKSYTIFLILPIFWSCYWLITTFQKNASDPVIFDFIYELLAVIFIVLTTYSVAGFNFGKMNDVKSRGFASCAIYFSVVALLGKIMRDILAGSLSMPGFLLDPVFFALVFSVLFSFYVIMAMGRNLKPGRLV